MVPQTKLDTKSRWPVTKNRAHIYPWLLCRLLLWCYLHSHTSRRRRCVLKIRKLNVGAQRIKPEPMVLYAYRSVGLVCCFTPNQFLPGAIFAFCAAARNSGPTCIIWTALCAASAPGGCLPVLHGLYGLAALFFTTSWVAACLCVSARLMSWHISTRGVVVMLLPCHWG